MWPKRICPYLRWTATRIFSGVYIGGFGITGQGPAPVKPGSESFKLTAQEQDLGQGVLCVPPGIPAATTQPYPDADHTEAWPRGDSLRGV